MRFRLSSVAILVVAAVATLACGGSHESDGSDAAAGAGSTTSASVSCAEGTPIGRRVFLAVGADDILMRAAPGTAAAPVLNARATAAMGHDEPRTVGPAYGLQGLCRTPEFVQVQIVEADGRPVNWESGWIEARYIQGAPTADEQAGLLWAVDQAPGLSTAERKTARAAALRILREDANCEKVIDGAKSVNRPGQIYATCKGRNGENYNVWFNAASVSSAARLGAPTPYPESRAREACESAIRAKVTLPSTLDLHRLTGYATTTHNNGNRTILQTFSAKNAVGESQTYDARCLVLPAGEVELTLTQR